MGLGLKGPIPSIMEACDGRLDECGSPVSENVSLTDPRDEGVRMDPRMDPSSLGSFRPVKKRARGVRLHDGSP